MDTQRRVGVRERAIRSASECIGEHLSARRRLRGITQTDLATRAGMSTRTLAKIENGDPGVSLGKVLAVARILGADTAVIAAFSPLSTPEGLYRMNSKIPKRVRNG